MFDLSFISNNVKIMFSQYTKTNVLLLYFVIAKNVLPRFQYFEHILKLL